jgi:hypothetical protein
MKIIFNLLITGYRANEQSVSACHEFDCNGNAVTNKCFRVEFNFLCGCKNGYFRHLGNCVNRLECSLGVDEY